MYLSNGCHVNTRFDNVVASHGLSFVCAQVERRRTNVWCDLLEGSNRDCASRLVGDHATLIKQKPHVEITLCDVESGEKRVETFSLNKVLQKLW